MIWKIHENLSALNTDGNERFPLFLLRTSLSTLHVALGFKFLKLFFII